MIIVKSKEENNGWTTKVKYRSTTDDFVVSFKSSKGGDSQEFYLTHEDISLIVHCRKLANM